MLERIAERKASAYAVTKYESKSKSSQQPSKAMTEQGTTSKKPKLPAKGKPSKLGGGPSTYLPPLKIISSAKLIA